MIPDAVDEEASEGLKPKVLKSPGDPSPEEIEEHEMMGHSVHRTWCGHCMRSRGLMEKHVQQKAEDKSQSIPTLGIDYFYFGKDEEGLPHLQVRDGHSGMSWASPVPAKGNDPFAVNFMLGVLDEVGYKRLVLKSDNEPAIKALKSSVKDSSKVDIILEESKTGDSQSNGLAEVAVRETKRQCRAMKSALQERLSVEVGEKHPILSWMARHGNFLVSRYRIGQDGRTGYEKLKGKRWKRPVVTFGERVWFRPLKSYMSGKSDFQDKLYTGRYVGTHGRNGDVLIMTKDGVIKGGSIKRMSPKDRWDASDLESLAGTPWNLRPKTPEDVDSLPVRIELPAAEGRLSPEVSLKDAIPRNLYVKRRDVEGQFTPGCPGCIAIQVGLPARSHNSECRTLVEQRLKETEEGKLRIERAQKRKAGDAALPALEDVPDLEEEMHAHDAIGRPLMEGVEPLVRPSPEQPPEQRVDPLGRPAASKRSSDGPEAESPKRAHAAASQGSKRAHEEEGIPSEVMEEIKRESKKPKGETVSKSALASSSSPGSKQVVKDVATILQARAARGASVEDILEIGQLLMAVGGSKSDVAEIYNPERFTSQANRFGLRPGFAIDLSLYKNNKEEHWDLSKEGDQKRLKILQQQEKPMLLIGSPPCGPFSPLQNLSKNKRTAEENEAILAEGRLHLEVAVDAYHRQIDNGRYFLHEHPKPSASWNEPCIQDLAGRDDVFVVQSPMCYWHMLAEDMQGVGHVRKETQYLTNSAELAKRLNQVCEGNHRHVHLINGRARQAQVYPPKLVKAILKGIKAELQNMGELSELSAMSSGPSPDDTSNDATEPFFNPEDVKDDEIWNSVTGTLLDPIKVWEARAEEMKWVKKQELWDVVDESQCWSETGKAPITLKWVDRNKSDDQKPNYRSRLVVREVKRATTPLAEHESYSAMPPLEALKVLLSLMASKQFSTRGKRYKLGLIDISRAHFYGQSKRRVYCTLPEGEEQAGKCALLKRTMYGTLDAANIWQETYVEILKEHNIHQCVGWPALFINEEHDLRFLVHGDDFLCLGDEDAIRFLEDCLKTKFEYRIDGLLGPDDKDDSHMHVLNRVVTFDKKTGEVCYEADPRHAQHIVRALGLEGCKPVSTPAEKQKMSDILSSEEMSELEREELTQFRSLTMRAAYLSADRADVAEAVKSLARHMSSPTAYSWTRLKRLGRYLAGKMRVVQRFRPQKMFNVIRVYCDSDHAGDLKTRKSTTGLVCMLGQHCVKHSSNLQSTISLSSGESEFYALVKAGAAGLGLKAMLDEWLVPCDLILLSDSSAARGIAARKGLGKTRHVQTRYLWIQERLREKEFKIEAVRTDKNLSDICTKPMSHDACWYHMSRMSQDYVAGKNVHAKRLD